MMKTRQVVISHDDDDEIFLHFWDCTFPFLSLPALLFGLSFAFYSLLDMHTFCYSFTFHIVAGGREGRGKEGFFSYPLTAFLHYSHLLSTVPPS